MSIRTKQAYIISECFQLYTTDMFSTSPRYGYHQYLFRRLITAGSILKTLRAQYRMKPSICEFYSAIFNDTIEFVHIMASQTEVLWHEKPCLGPLAFLDICG